MKATESPAPPLGGELPEPVELHLVVLLGRADTPRVLSTDDSGPAGLTTAQMLCNMQHMARGQSGRIVLEIDPALKRALHARLAGEGMTMKDWFLRMADELLNPKQQSLPLPTAPSATPAVQMLRYSTGKRHK